MPKPADRPLPPPPAEPAALPDPVYLYDENGEQSISVRADESQDATLFDRNWGVQYDKANLEGQIINIIGLESAPDFGNGPTIAVLFRFDDDPAGLAPWGVMFSLDGHREDGSRTYSSPLAGHAIGHFKRHRSPLRGRVVRKPSKTKGHNPYWDLLPPGVEWPPVD